MESIGLPHFDISRSIIHPLGYSPFEKLGVHVSIKRDDLIHPVASGNKWRKLKPYILQAKDSGFEGILTFGGAYSNHLVATAAACATFGLKSIGVVRGDERPQSFTLACCASYGMELMYVSRSAYREKNALSLALKPQNYLVIPEGGAGTIGESGLEGFWDEVGNIWDYVVLAVATQTTFNGLLKFRPQNVSTKIVGISVLKGNVPSMFNNAEIAIGYEYGGYGKFDSDLLRHTRQLTQETGLLFDPVYTTKALIALQNLIDIKKITPGSSVLFLHTGGTFGLVNDKFITLSLQY